VIRRSDRLGFTLIEVVIAIAIIALLASMLIYGTSHLSSSARGSNTRAVFEASKMMMSEYESQVGGHFGLKVNPATGHLVGSRLNYWRWYARPAGYTATPPTPAAYVSGDPNQTAFTATEVDLPANPYSLNFWTCPCRIDTATPLGTINRLDLPAPIYSPGSVNRHNAGIPSVHANINGTVAMLNTHLAMIAMQSMAENRRIVENLPTTELAPLEWEANTFYLPGMVIAVKSPTGANVFLRCVNPHMSSIAPTVSSSSPPVISDVTNWGFGQNAPFLLDGWGNPICFVPGSGMQVGALYDNGKSYVAGDRAYVVSGTDRTYYVCLQNSNGNQPPSASFWQAATPIRDPGLRPFFASAGPDGDFDTEADNLYSFKN
jgi:prepilin-type N-terminal cleavage/methylation domain-containing protein